MPTLFERLFGKKPETKVEQPTNKVSEEAARLRREQLEKERLAAEEARKRAEEAEKQRLAAIEAQKAAAALAAHEYVVKSGDSLSKIAKALYGDAKRWPEIYEANKALIGDNPNLIHPGQKLIIK